MTTLIRELTPETTKQELFDYITAFLMKQGRPSIESNLGALFTRDGRMCAFGCVIPKKFRKLLPRKNMSVDAVLGTLVKSKDLDAIAWAKTIEKFESFLTSMLVIHDTCTFLDRTLYNDNLRDQFQWYAHKHNLNFNPELWRLL